MVQKVLVLGVGLGHPALMVGGRGAGSLWNPSNTPMVGVNFYQLNLSSHQSKVI